VDFFVHDILDYSVLNKKESTFHIHNEVFDIEEAVQHIIQLQEDKAKIKNI
jgi:signal transduction histidine kinase